MKRISLPSVINFSKENQLYVLCICSQKVKGLKTRATNYLFLYACWLCRVSSQASRVAMDLDLGLQIKL